MKKPKILICIVLTFIFLVTTLSPSFEVAAAPKAPEFAPGEVILGFETITFDVIEAINASGGSVIMEISALNALVVTVSHGREDMLIQNARSIPGFKYAERNGIWEAVYTPNDPSWASLWNMRIIEADNAWDIHKGSSSVVVAVVDTGVDYNHQDLAANYMSGGRDWVTPDNDPFDDNYHGTHVAGTVAAVMDNSIGVVGVAQVSILAEKVLDAGGSGLWSWIANGITHATDMGVDVISMSLGGYGYSTLIDNSCTYAWNNGVLVVAAAGNDNLNIDANPFYPASLSTVIAVSSTTSTDQKSSFSNWGNTIEVSGPGTSIYSTLPGNSYGYLSGTSMATPHVSGVAALTWSLDPTLTNQEMRERLHTAVDDLGDPGKDIFFGYGRINAFKALSPQPPLPHHFLFDGFIDELWLSFNLDGTVNGFDEAPGSYTAPVLGMWASGGMLLFLDFPTGIGPELMMLIVSFPSLSGTGWFTTDGLIVDGPFSYQLIHVALAETGEAKGERVLAAGVEASEVKPALVGPFTLNPFTDEEWFGQFAPGKINGYADVPGSPEYPAPHLGVVTPNVLIFADDYLSVPGSYELRLNIINRPGLAGISYATVDGITVDGPTNVWLT